MLRISAIICLSLFLFVTPVHADAATPEKFTGKNAVRRNTISDAGYEAFYAESAPIRRALYLREWRYRHSPNPAKESAIRTG